MGHLNVSGWTPHNNVLRSSIVTSESLDIFIVSETHLSNCDDFEPNVAGYIFKGFNRSVMHRNAPGTWGGVGFLIKRDLLKEYTFQIVEQSYEGIFGIELIHKAMNIRVLLIACYLPPENSPYGRNVDGFLSHLEQICYTYSSEYDYILFAGDINARIGDMSDSEPDIDISLPDRTPIDMVHNSHGQSFIQFLRDCKMCVLSGRFNTDQDNFTYISNRGKSVVDYFFCAHKIFKSFSDFCVVTSTDLANMHNLTQLIVSQRLVKSRCET